MMGIGLQHADKCLANLLYCHNNINNDNNNTVSCCRRGGPPSAKISDIHHLEYSFSITTCQRIITNLKKNKQFSTYFWKVFASQFNNLLDI